MTDDQDSNQSYSDTHFKNQNGLVCVFDADEYLFPIAEVEKSKDRSLLPSLPDNELMRLLNDPNYLRVVYSCYFQIKNSIIATPGDFVTQLDEEVKTLRSKGRNFAVEYAEYFASRYLATNSLIKPEWIKNIDILLSSHDDARVTEIWKECTKKYNQYPSLQPLTTYENGAHTIHISILMRSFLKALLCPYSCLREKLDLLSWSVSQRKISKSIPSNFKEDLFKIYLIYSWFTKDDFHIVNLPDSIFINISAFGRASHIAYLQLQFILLHEIAHIYFGHATKMCSANLQTTSESDGVILINLKALGIEAFLSETNQPIKTLAIPRTEEDNIEIKADEFAFEKLLEIPNANNDMCLFSVLSLLNFLHMFEATTNIKDSKIELENCSDSDMLLLKLKRFTGQAAKRRAFAERKFRDSWNDEGQHQAYVLFSNFTDMYIEWLSETTMDQLREIIDRRTYDDERFL